MPQQHVPGHEVILVAEDDDAIRQLVMRVLKKEGYSVLEARSPEEALAVSEAYSGEIALLVSDVVMPRFTGRWLAQRLAAARPSIRVLFMSGFAKEDVVALGVAHGEVNFLNKPFTAEQMIAAVRGAVDSG